LSGNRPSGSYDPLAVRRNGYAVIQLIDAFDIHLDLSGLVGTMLDTYNMKIEDGVLPEFFAERLTRYLQDKGYRYDEIKAVLAIWNGDVADAKKRCEAIKAFRGSPEFVKLVIGQKRVRNILKNVKAAAAVDKEFVNQPSEKALVRMGEKVRPDLDAMIASKNYPEVLRSLLEMRPAIDKFFDDVLVMCEDKRLRENRLALVSTINELFLRFADFSQIVIEGEKT
jgi:glycyl-tRNA synthetase beta chain